MESNTTFLLSVSEDQLACLNVCRIFDGNFDLVSMVVTYSQRVIFIANILLYIVLSFSEYQFACQIGL